MTNINKKDMSHLHLAVHLVELRGLEAHALRDAQQRGGVARERVGGHVGVAAHEVHLHGGGVVLERQQPLPHDGVAAQQHLQRVGLARHLAGVRRAGRGGRARRAVRGRRRAPAAHRVHDVAVVRRGRMRGPRHARRGRPAQLQRRRRRLRALRLQCASAYITLCKCFVSNYSKRTFGQ